MAGRQWPSDQIERLREFLAAGLSYSRIAELLGISYNATRQKARDLGVPSTAISPGARHIAPPEVPTYNGAFVLDGDLGGGLVVCADVHAPCTDWAMAAKVGAIGAKYLKKPRRLVICGDLLNFEVFSKWDMLITLPPFEVERAAAQYAIQSWLDVYDDIYLTMGNHDYRLFKAMKGAFDGDTLIELLQALICNDERVHISVYPYMSVVCQNSGNWRITHGEYAQTPLFKARRLSVLHHSNVITAHQHGCAAGLDESRHYAVMDLPALVDPERLAYVMLADTTKPRMARGFAAILNGAAYLFSDNPALTDWGRWL